MPGVIELLAALAILLGALLCGLWLVTRQPEQARQLAAVRSDSERLRALLARLQQEALDYADVNPVAQVFLDEINQTLGAKYAPVKRKDT